MSQKPKWLTVRVPSVEKMELMQKFLGNLSLQTVCQNAECPNIGECFSNGTSTFMILGNICTRNCRFCAVQKGIPAKPDAGEPQNVAAAVKELDLRHVVVTSVTRDDLDDGGAGQFAAVIQSIRAVSPGTSIEVLIPDFKGNTASLETVIEARPDVINHNVETVPRLYEQVRPETDYTRSINLLKNVKELAPHIYTKSGLMLGLGEKEEEVLNTFDDLLGAKCDILTLGQYLRPTKKHLKVKEYVEPAKFDDYKHQAENKGFKYVASGPLVRSSYKALEALKNLK